MGGVAAFHFVSSLELALKYAAGLLLIHVRSDFTMGPGARKNYGQIEGRQEAGRLFLEDHPAAFQRLECALSLLDKAPAAICNSATPLSLRSLPPVDSSRRSSSAISICSKRLPVGMEALRQ